MDLRNGVVSAYALAALSGLLLSLSYALHPFWLAAWLAPAPIIIATLRAPASHRRWVSLLAGAFGGISTFAYHLTVGGWFAALLIFVLVALAWSSAIRLAVVFAERCQFSLALLSVPVVWAAIDTLLIHLSPHGSAGSIAYSQMNALPVIQVASLGGMPAITFVVLLGGSLLGLLIGKGLETDRKEKLVAGIAAIFLIGATLAFGFIRLDGTDRPSGPNTVLVATDSVDRRQTSWGGFLQVYGGAIEQSAKPGSIVVLPEAVLDLPEAQAEVAGRELAERAFETRSTIVVGMSVEGVDEATGRALIAQPDGRFHWYIKQHLIPGIEGALTPGTQPLVVASATTKIGVAICKDMHFPTLGREYAQQGAELMLVPANDFEVDDWLTARMTVLRGVESGFSIARAARGGGISFVSDRYGRVLAERRSDGTMGVLEAEIPLRKTASTVYTAIGDLFGWLCALGWVILTLLRYGLFERVLGRVRS
ncbi:nitrilase-related carbon-nitrogen hydrolase [Blastomonas fulva]|uniref:nitrilase-related carbon-nitrogen hydrolase n=1 Tax=Blastomonas fulva TaxID=1550728 RepID=UPI0013C37A5D|nr:nitrilase-related carbon-nitrogen hydrolase [Blastomonas fulva]